MMTTSRAGVLALGALLAGACAADGPLGPSSNRAPQVRSVTLTPPVVPLGGTATLRVDAVDPDGDTLYFHYRAQGGTVTPDPSDTSQAVYRNDGVARVADRITVTVVDTSSAATTTEAAVPLQGNRAPVVVRIAGQRSCHPSCSLSLEAVANDPDNDPLTYAWTGCASGTTSSARCSLSTVGEVTATVTVQDGRGGSTSLGVVLEGTNSPPVVSGGQVLRGYTQATFVVSAVDPDNDTLTCGWLGTCLCQGGSGINLQCYLPGELASCLMRFACSDPFGAAGSTTFELHR
jgi:hypothetical protein